MHISHFGSMSTTEECDLIQYWVLLNKRNMFALPHFFYGHVENTSEKTLCFFTDSIGTVEEGVWKSIYVESGLKSLALHTVFTV